MKDYPDGPYFVPPYKESQGGVDFLGLRQVNLDLMVQCLPGINNAVWHLRPFAILSWIYWKFHRLAQASGIPNPTANDLQEYREKIEVLFTWSHKIGGFQGIPGISATPTHEGEAEIPLTFEEWKRDDTSTSLMAPVQYGPASKTTDGLGFLEPVHPPFYRTCNKGVALAEGLEESMQRVGQSGLLNSLGSASVSAEVAGDLLEGWSIVTPTEKEKAAFRAGFFDDATIVEDSNLGRRSQTVALVRTVLKHAAAPLDVAGIRQAMTFLSTPTGERFTVPDRLAAAAERWLVLQLRQAQRLAFESLFSWLEQQILDGHVTTSEEVAEIAHRDIKDSTVAELFETTVEDAVRILQHRVANIPSWREASLMDEGLSIFDQMRSVKESIVRGVAGTVPTSLELLFVIDRLTRLLFENGETRQLLVQGGAQRVSLKHWGDVVACCGGYEIRQFLRFLIENYLLSQHFAVATSRYDGRSQRLRITIEEEGLVCLSSERWNPNVTEDRLATALSLMSECGLVRGTEDSNDYVYADL